MDFLNYQRQLLDHTRQIYRHAPITKTTEEAFLATPRHLFVRRYREWGSKEWLHVDGGNLHEHLATLYANRPLILCGDHDDDIASTISPPSLVLRMLDLLQVRLGQSVLELGAGSGWNAALLGQLVGPSGNVHSLEIIPELARNAADTVTHLGIKNLHIIHADGGHGHPAGAPYDRIVFTAGSYDIPRHFYEQIKPGGLLLAVVKNVGGGDNLFLLRKTQDYFRSLDSMPCMFVQLSGEYKIASLGATFIEESPQWAELQHREIARRSFWWGDKGQERFHLQTAAFRSFLGITDPMFRTFKTPKREDGGFEEEYFGLWNGPQTSLVLAKYGELVSYGTMAATERLVQALHKWVDLGMPSAASFSLRVHRSDHEVTAHASEWRIKRAESQFLWSLDTCA